MSATLSQPITRTATVQGAQPGQKGSVQVILAVQPTETSPAATLPLTVSADEWNRIAATQGPGGIVGLGVSLSIVIE